MPATTITWVEGMKFSAVSQSGHTVFLDAASQAGGENEGIRPMEMVLGALGGCTGIDVVSILNKMRVAYTAFAIDAEGARQEEHPKVFREITLNYRFDAPAEAEDRIKRAVHLSQEKYCSVSAMLAATARIKTQIFLNGSPVEVFAHAPSAGKI